MAADLARIKLLLLDLDDTLFDCAGTLIPAAHRDAVTAMIEAGLPGPVSERLAELQPLLEQVRDASVVYPRLCAKHAVEDPAVAETGCRAFFQREVPPIEPFPGVIGALTIWGGRFTRVVVTFGDPGTQARKVQRLHLLPHLDGVRYVGPGQAGGKEMAFRLEIAARELSPSQALVVGNRLSDEIAAGNRLGCPTVLVAGGEFANQEPSGPEEQPLHRIERFSDLVGLLAG